MAEADPAWAACTQARSWRAESAIAHRLYDRTPPSGPAPHPSKTTTARRAYKVHQSEDLSRRQRRIPNMVSRFALLAACLLVASPAAGSARRLGGTPVALVTAE